VKRSGRSLTPARTKGGPSERDAPLERLPPYDIDAEMGVLGSMLLDNDAIAHVVQALRPECFYKEAHRLLFETILHCYQEYNTVDLVILRDELKKLPSMSPGTQTALEQVGGAAYLMELEEAVPTAANVDYYAGIVKEKAVRRMLIETTTAIQRQAYEDSGEIGQLLDTAEKQMFELRDMRSVRPVQKVGDTLKLLIEHFDRREKEGLRGALTGVPTGFADLDELTGGLQPGEFVIIAARPSVGKTSLLLNMLHHISVVERAPSVLYSLEMNANQIVSNFLCIHNRIDGTRLRRVDLDDQQWQDLSYALDEFAEAPLYVDDTTGINILELRARARRMQERHGISLLAVDYLQLMEPTTTSSRNRTREQEVGEISRGLKGLARELNIPVVAAAQLNRSVEARLDHKPRLADLRESGSMEQDADVVVLLHREMVSAQERRSAADLVELIVAKQRNGPQGLVRLTFFPNFVRFEPAAPETFP